MTIRPFQLERYFAKWEFTAPHILSASDSESLTVGEVLELTHAPPDALMNLHLGYTESQGDPLLREAILDFYPGLSTDQIITAVPEEAIFLTMWALIEPGDKVVVQTPCYQSLSEVATDRGAQVQPWPLTELESGWHADLDQLADLLTPNTKLLVINTPHNPTGYHFTAAEFEVLLNLVRERDIWLFCDEMYRGAEYDLPRRLPPACTRYEKAISLSGMSKSFGLPGLRLGWLALQDESLMNALKHLKDYTTICGSAPSEILARLAIYHAETFFKRSATIIRANLDHMRQFLAQHPDFLAWRDPQAGSIAFPRLRQGHASQTAATLVQEAGVLLVPSPLFDFGDSHVRFGLGRRNFPDALNVLSEYLSR